VATDVHAHCVPVNLPAALSAVGSKLGVEVLRSAGSLRIRVLGGATTPPLNPLLMDLPARLSAMDRMGVSRQVISPFIDLTAYELGDSAGMRYARLVNELMAATVDETAGRLLALGTVPLPSGKLAATELQYAVEQLGMVGVEIGTHVHRTQLDDPALDPFWAAAEALACVVLVHPLSGASMDEPYFLGNVIGNPAATTMAVARLMFGGVIERFPSVRLCLAHGGGFLPYQAGRLERAFHAIGRSRGARLTRSPMEILGQLYYDTVLHSPAMIRSLIDLVGADHVMLGSDYPFDMGDPDPIGTLAQVPGLEATQYDSVCSGNLERLLAGIPTPRTSS